LATRFGRQGEQLVVAHIDGHLADPLLAELGADHGPKEILGAGEIFRTLTDWY